VIDGDYDGARVRAIGKSDDFVFDIVFTDRSNVPPAAHLANRKNVM
jgi:hypothetical protein